MRKNKIKQVARNKQAYFNFEIIEKFEAGISLMGSEVKSLRQGHVQFADSHARPTDTEILLVNLDIPRYEQAGFNNHAPTRTRKLLLNKREIRKIKAKIAERGLTLVPLRIYFRGSWAKVELGLCRGKRLHDKRETIKRREAKVDIDRAMKRRR